MFEAVDRACRGQVFWDRFSQLTRLPFDPRSSVLDAVSVSAEGQLVFCRSDADDDDNFQISVESVDREVLFRVVLDSELRFLHGFSFGEPLTDVGAADAYALVGGPFAVHGWEVYAPGDVVVMDDEDSGDVRDE